MEERYNVYIQQINQWVTTVTADSRDEAIAKARARWYKENAPRLLSVEAVVRTPAYSQSFTNYEIWERAQEVSTPGSARILSDKVWGPGDEFPVELL